MKTIGNFNFTDFDLFKTLCNFRSALNDTRDLLINSNEERQHLISAVCSLSEMCDSTIQYIISLQKDSNNEQKNN